MSFENELKRIELNSRVNELYYNDSTLEGYLKVWRNGKAGKEDVRIYRFEDFRCPARDFVDGLVYEEGDMFVDCLVRYINQQGGFQVYKTRNAPVHRKKNGSLGLEELYYALANGKKLDVKELKALRIRMSVPHPIMIIGAEELNRDEFKDENGKRYLIYWLSRTAIHSEKRFSWDHSRGVIYNDLGSTVVTWEGELFWVDKNEGLEKILQRLSNKKIEEGALKLRVGGEYIPLGAVVYIYFTIIKAEGVEEISLINDGYKSYREQDYVVDHLTENKQNNHIWALALMPHWVNGGMRDRRSRVKAPYFFYTVYDLVSKCCKVQCGVIADNVKWEKRFAFDWSNVDDAAQRYKACFDEFWDKLPREYKLDKPGEESCLYYWAEPERATDTNNPLMHLHHMQEDCFKEYKQGAFVDLPLLPGE